jgi:uncharacterized protein
MVLFLYLIVGVLAGTLSGMLGIGGGLVVVPALVFIFKSGGFFTNEIIMHVAVGTSLSVMMFTASSSARAFHKRGFIVWPLFFRFVPGLCLGMVFGALVANKLSSNLLIFLFAIFLLFLAAYLSFNKKDKKSLEKENIVENKLMDGNHLNISSRMLVFLVLSSMGVGTLSTMFGIGGGMLTIPFFLFMGFNIREASGSSAVCGVPVAIVGSILLTLTGLDEVKNTVVPTGTLGFVYWPAVLIISSTSMIFAPVGTHISVYFQPKTIKRILAGLLICTSLNMLYSNLL